MVDDGVPRVEVLVVDHGEERALPVFSGEGKAEMFVWLGDAFEDGWSVRESSAGEHASILYGPCAGVGSVALGPSPGIEAEMVGLLSETRGGSWAGGVGAPRARDGASVTILGAR